MFEAGKRLITRGKLVFVLIIILSLTFITSCTNPTNFEEPTQISPTIKSEFINTVTVTPTHFPTLTPEILPTQTTTPAATAAILLPEIADEFGVEMVIVPAGEFTMGKDANKAFVVEECQDNKDRYSCQPDRLEAPSPEHQIYLDAFYMDKYEVTNALYKDCVDAGVCEPPKLTSSNSRSSYYENPQFDNYPVINVDWIMAYTYCNDWRDGYLPSEAQWEKAARGGLDGKKFPWGDEDPIRVEGAENGAWIQDHSDGKDTGLVGSYSPNGYGLYDMSGNVGEWVDDWYNAYPGNSFSSPHYGTTHRIERDGGWNRHDLGVWGRMPQPPDSYYYSLGFRCAHDATPTKIITPTLSPTPEGQLYYDDFEGEEKTYISLEDDPNLVSKGITTIDDNHVYYVDTITQTTLLFSELLDTTEPLEDYAVQFDIMLSNQPKLSLDDISWFSVDLRSNRRDNGTSFEYYTLSWGFWLHKARDGSLRNSQINLGFYGSDQEPIEIGIKQGDHYFFYENFWYHIRVEAKDNEFKWYFIDRYNEALHFRYVDEENRSPSGWPSFSFGPDTGVTFYFDNILVEELK